MPPRPGHPARKLEAAFGAMLIFAEVSTWPALSIDLKSCNEAK